MFFIYDNTVLQKEEDDLKDAIIYFDPSDTPVNSQCEICGQLMGMVLLCKNLMGSYPTLYKLQKQKFAVKCLGRYSLALSGNGMDDMLVSQLDSLHSLFIFYQNSMKQYYNNPGVGCNNQQHIWASYVQFIHHYGNKVTAAFRSLPFIEIPKSQQQKGQLIVLESTHLLQYCAQHFPVYAGCILYRNSILCTELNADMTFRLLLIGPQQQQSHGLQAKQFDKPLPDGVQIIPVYLTSDEYKLLLPNLQCKTQKFEPAQHYDDNMEKTSSENSDSGSAFESNLTDGDQGAFVTGGNKSANIIPTMKEHLLEKKYGTTNDFGIDKTHHIEQNVHMESPKLLKQTITNDPTEIMKNIKSIAARNRGSAVMKIEHDTGLKGRSKSWSLDETQQSSEENAIKAAVDVCIMPNKESNNGNSGHSTLDQINVTVVTNNEPDLNSPLENEGQTSLPISEGNSSLSTEQSFSILSQNDVDSVISSASESEIATDTPYCGIVSFTTCKDIQFKNFDSKTKEVIQESIPNKSEGENMDNILVYDRFVLAEESENSVSVANETDMFKVHNTPLNDSTTVVAENNSGTKLKQVACASSPAPLKLAVNEQTKDVVSDDSTNSPRSANNKSSSDEITEENNLLGSKETSWTDFMKYEDEQNVPADLYVQSNSEMVIILLMEKSATNTYNIVEKMWRHILPQLAKLEAELQMSLQNPQPKKTNEVLSYNFLQFNGHKRSLSGKIAISENKVQPLSADESHFCETAVMLHDLYSTHPYLKDVTLRNSRSVIYGHNMMLQETFFQKILGRSGSDAPSEKDSTLLIERRAKEKLQKDQGITIL